MLSFTTPSDGVRIDYDDTGAGEPALLCLHGWCGSRRQFEPFVHVAREHRRVLAVDWAGHGTSSSRSREFGFADIVADIEALIAHTGLQRVVPVTLSHGGWVAVDLCTHMRRRISALIVINWLVFPPPRYFLEGLRRMQDSSSWNEARDSLNKGWLAGASREAAQRELAARELHGFPMFARAAREIERRYEDEGSPLALLARLTDPPPTLCLYGDLGSTDFSSVLAAFSAGHSWFSSQPVIPPSHFPTVDEPEATAAIIEAFVRQHS